MIFDTMRLCMYPQCSTRPYPLRSVPGECDPFGVIRDVFTHFAICDGWMENLRHKQSDGGYTDKSGSPTKREDGKEIITDNVICFKISQYYKEMLENYLL